MDVALYGQASRYQSFMKGTVECDNMLHFGFDFLFFLIFERQNIIIEVISAQVKM